MNPPINPQHLAFLIYEEIQKQLPNVSDGVFTLSFFPTWEKARPEVREMFVAAADLALRKLTDPAHTHINTRLPRDE